MPTGTPTPWSYALIRFLFRFVLKIFYGSIVIENIDAVPKTGRPCIVCANHSNSLTDALLLVTSIPTNKRNMLRLTAKATQFGHRTFTSWLIESAGTVPIKRRKDHGDADNSEVMEHLMKALERGDAVCLFPEGMSRYHPTIAPLKTGVARLVSDVLSRNRDDPDFEISVLPVSITYMHRQHFRSDVLVTFQSPLTFTPKNNPELLSPVEFTNAYQDRLAKWGIKDDRIRRPLPRHTILSRLIIRLMWSVCLFAVSLPGLALWVPIFATTFYAVHNFKKTGPIFDTWDEIAQYKLIYGLMSGICVWISAVALTLPFAVVTVFLVPAFMWMTLRWFEDAVASFRAFTALFRLLRVGTPTLKEMHEIRRDLHSRVVELAVRKLNLPEDPEMYFARVGGREKGRIRGSWDSRARYFSIKRRRKRDWNETLRLYDKVDYPEDD
ncbi:hypothetical protein NLJ89_g7566 [Agrocybe chaxingu]|uniref:Phospholipid/glycerol acyltransferase domain-containing protein n=1 Tax=Agrocybe chaxingu TaxID=84603 RepID=A0A9W8MTJ9_9AGAR|nr:hypothetical protein NLJ89_g7566 [Agrocybe chaxingu]